MYDKNRCFLLEFRYKSRTEWTECSGFRRLCDAKLCVDDTLSNVSRVLEGRVFDRKLMAYRYYRTDYPFKP